MANHIRVYLVIDASAARTPAQWNSLINAVKDKPMVLAVRLAANVRDMPHNHVNINRPSTSARFMLGDFEIDKVDATELLAVLAAQCTARGIAHTTIRADFAALIQAELREAAIDLGYTPAQAANLSVGIVGYGERLAAIAEGQAWLVAAGGWE